MKVPRQSLLFRRTVVGVVAILFANCAALIMRTVSASDPNSPYATTIDSYTTHFDPATDMLPVRNDYKVPKSPIEQLPWQRSIADDGRCRGINETNISYFTTYHNDRSRPALTALGTTIENNFPGVLDKAAASAQLFAGSRGIRRYGTSALPSGVSPAEQIVKDMKETGLPQVLSIRTQSNSYHSISAYGYTIKRSQGVRGYIFNIADPNYEPGTPENKTKTLVYEEDESTHEGHWDVYNSGPFVYNTVFLRRDPAQPSTWDTLRSYVTGKPATKSAAERNPIPNPRLYLKVLEEAEKGKVMPPPRVSQSSDGVAGIAVTKDEVGGVLVQFDPSAFAESTGQDDHQIDAQIQSFLNSNHAGTLAIKSSSGAESFETMSLKRWLASGEPSLGLTRVRGYIIKDDDVWLIGKRDASMPAVDGDLLTVALSDIYHDGSTPFVSLDPNPVNFYGPQQVRVGGISQKFEQSQFVRVMLDADYDMKRISLGELAVEVPEFQSWYEILRKSEDAEPGVSRSWLTPISFTVGDVFESGPALIFQSNVQVLTERMKDFSDYSAWPGESSPEGELAAQLMTRHFSGLERKVPTFYRLHGLFDIAKLAAVLRYKQVKSTVLDQIANRSIRVVQRSREYAGIGPKIIQGTLHIIGGGAVAKVHLAKSGFSQSNAVSSFLSGQETISLESSMELAPAVNPDLLVNAAAQDYSRNDLESCVIDATEAIKADDDAYEAYLYRALANASLGNSAQAISDLDHVVKNVPQMEGLRGVIKLYTGDVDGANTDVDECASKFPALEESWLSNAQVKVYSLDFSAAQSALDHLFQLNGMSLEAHSLKATATMLARMEPKDAGDYVKHMTQLPLPLAEAFWRAYAATHSFDSESAKKSYEHALELAESESNNPKVKDLFAAERVLFLLTTLTAKEEPNDSSGPARADAALQTAKAKLEKAESDLRIAGALLNDNIMSREEYDKQQQITADVKQEYDRARLSSRPAIKYAQRLIDSHPDWASGYVARSLALIGAGAEHAPQASELMAKAFARDTKNDPLIHDLELYYGHEIKNTFYALEYMLTSTASGSTSAQRLAFLQPLSNGQSSVATLADAVIGIETTFEERKNSADKSRPPLNAKIQETVKQAIANHPANDLAEMILYSRMLVLYTAWEIDDDPNEALRAARAVQLNLPADDATPEAVSIIGALRVEAFDFLANAYFARAQEDSKLKQFAEDATTGNVRLDEIKSRSQVVAQHAVQESKRLDPQVVNKLLNEIFLPNIADDVQDSTLSKARTRIIEKTATETPTPVEQTGTEQVVTTPSPTPTPPLETIDSARTALEEKRYKITPEQTTEAIAAAVDGIIAAAQTPADLKFLEVFFLRLTTMGQVIAMSDGQLEKAAKINALHESMSAKLRLRGMKIVRSSQLPATSYRALVWPSPPFWRQLPLYAYAVLIAVAVMAILFWRLRHRRQPVAS